MINENYKVVPLMNKADVSTGADCDSFNMSLYHKATVIFTFGTVDANATITPKSGATSGAKTTDIPAKYAVGSATIGAPNSDVLGAWIDEEDDFTIATASNKFVVVEISGAAIKQGEPWVTITVNASNDAGACHAVAILEPRYKSGQSPSAL